jgi:hypothetical protein
LRSGQGDIKGNDVAEKEDRHCKREEERETRLFCEERLCEKDTFTLTGFIAFARYGFFRWNYYDVVIVLVARM